MAEAKLEVIEALLAVVPKVIFMNTPGNHDHFHNFALHEALGMRFSGSGRV